MVFPVIAHRCLVKHKNNLGKDEVKVKYGSLYQNVRADNGESLRFTLYFCMRRLVFAGIIVLLKDYLML